MARKPPPEHTRFKKGQSGNPQGARLHNPEIRLIKRMTLDQVVEIGSLVLDGNVAELKRIARDEKESVLKVMLAAVAARTITKGDPEALDALLDRLIGKVPNPVQLSGQGGSPLQMYMNLKPEERQQLMREYAKRLAAPPG